MFVKFFFLTARWKNLISEVFPVLGNVEGNTLTKRIKNTSILNIKHISI